MLFERETKRVILSWFCIFFLRSIFISYANDVGFKTSKTGCSKPGQSPRASRCLGARSAGGEDERCVATIELEVDLGVAKNTRRSRRKGVLQFHPRRPSFAHNGVRQQEPAEFKVLEDGVVEVEVGQLDVFKILTEFLLVCIFINCT